MKTLTELANSNEKELTLQEKIELALQSILTVEQNLSSESELKDVSIANISDVAERIVKYIEINENVTKLKTQREIDEVFLEHNNNPFTKRQRNLNISFSNSYKVDMNKIDAASKADVQKQLDSGNGFVQVYKVTENTAHIYGSSTDNYLYSTVLIPADALIQ